VVNNVNVKDISKLGRDLSKVIIIDNISDNFQKQSENGIFITTWLGNEKDTELYDLIPILREIVIKKVKDVRKVLRKLRDTLIRLYVKGDPTPLDTLKKCLAKTFQEESKG
jgi:CTD small phosphatase-like protein 2